MNSNFIYLINYLNLFKSESKIPQTFFEDSKNK